MRVQSKHKIPPLDEDTPATVWVPILGRHITVGDTVELPDVYGDPDEYDWPEADWEILDRGEVGKKKMAERAAAAKKAAESTEDESSTTVDSSKTKTKRE